LDETDITRGSGEVPADQMRLSRTGNGPHRAKGALDCAEMQALVQSLTNLAEKSALEALFGAEVADAIEFVLLAARRNPSYSARVHEDERSLLRFGEEKNTRAARARALAFLREMRGYTQKKLAEASGIHNATISSYERGKREIGDRNLETVLLALGLPLRAWDATVRHIEWLDWLARRRKEANEMALQAEGLGLASAAGKASDLDMRREIEHVAEAAGREREQTVTRVLELVLRHQR